MTGQETLAPAVGTAAVPQQRGLEPPALICGRPADWPHLITCYGPPDAPGAPYVGRHRDPLGQRATRKKT